MKVQYEKIHNGIILRAEDGRTINFGKEYFESRKNPKNEEGDMYIEVDSFSILNEKEFNDFYEETRKKDEGFPIKIEKLEFLIKKIKNYLTLQGIDLDF